MLRTSMQLGLFALALMFGGVAAHATTVQNAQLTLGSTGKITAIAEDGQTYSRLELTDLNFHGSVHVMVSSGQVRGIAIYNGACGSLCPGGIGYKSLFKERVDSTRNLNKDVAFDVSADDYPQGLAQNLEASKIFQACHERMAHHFTGGDVTFTHLMKVTLSLSLHDGPPASNEGSPGEFNHDWWDDYTVPVLVTCKAPQSQIPGGIAQDMGELRTKGIDLFLTTYANAVTHPNPATSCKKGRILVRMETSKAGPVKFRLWTKVGNSPISAKVVDAWSAFDGNGKYLAEHTEWVPVDEPTQFQAMAEDMVNGIGLQTQWKTLMLQCTGAGGGAGGKGGGLTVGNDEPLLPGLKITGDFAYVDTGGPKCPRNGRAFITFKSNRSDNIHYSLDCTNGQHFSGYVKPTQVPQKGYVAAATQTFQIDKTTVYSCALKTVQPGPLKLHQWKGHTFACVTRGGVSSPGNLAPKPPAAQGQTQRPAKTTPQISCAGGTVQNGQCVCPFGSILVKAAPNAWRCDKIPVQPPPKPITCAGGTVQGGRCVCASGYKPAKVGTKAWRCVKNVLAPSPKPKTSCAGGRVQGGRCVCARSYKPVKVGKNAWRCAKIAVAPPKPKISCAGGRVQGGRCVCARSYKPVKAGANAWRCVKIAVAPPPRPRISCAGGRVQGGRCVCARSYKPVKAGTNAWRCVRVAAPAR